MWHKICNVWYFSQCLRVRVSGIMSLLFLDNTSSVIRSWRLQEMKMDVVPSFDKVVSANHPPLITAVVWGQHHDSTHSLTQRMLQIPVTLCSPKCIVVTVLSYVFPAFDALTEKSTERKKKEKKLVRKSYPLAAKNLTKFRLARALRSPAPFACIFPTERYYTPHLALMTCFLFGYLAQARQPSNSRQRLYFIHVCLRASRLQALAHAQRLSVKRVHRHGRRVEAGGGGRLVHMKGTMSTWPLSLLLLPYLWTRGWSFLKSTSPSPESLLSNWKRRFGRDLQVLCDLREVCTWLRIADILTDFLPIFWLPPSVHRGRSWLRRHQRAVVMNRKSRR